MRTRKSIYNIIGVMSLYIIKIVLSFFGKTYLIDIMGDEYNGINALFNSIISMLSIAELGIGSAIIYNLYKPVKENDIEKIKSIIHFYKICYTFISGIIMLLGICITPFIRDLVGEVNITDNIYILFYLFLFDSVASYLLTYKRSIFYANQKNYIISVCDIGYTFIVQILQIAALIVTHNFVIYLILGILCKIAENLVIQYAADKKYPYLKERNIVKLSKAVRSDIIEKVKGLLFHKIGSYIVFGTDNMIISRMVNVVAEGLYSNYLMIINPLSNIIAQIISAFQASVGNLLVDNNKEKNYSIYKKIALLNFWLYTVTSICLFYLIQDFIVLWLGEKYLFSNSVAFVLSLNFWQTGMRAALGVFKNAAGIYYEDRFVPLIESVVNLMVSVILTKLYGIVGVFIGTFVSSLIIFLYSFPVLVYKPLFGKNYHVYVQEILHYAMEWSICFILTHIVVKGMEFVVIDNSYLMFAIKAVIIFITTNIILLIANNQSQEYSYYKEKIKIFFKNICIKNSVI